MIVMRLNRGKPAKGPLIGGDGNDTILGSNDDDYIDGAKGNDSLNGGSGHDTIWGNDGNDIVNGNAGNDYLHGGKGNDFIAGGDGNDVLFEYSGSNRLWGHEGNDIFVLSGGNNIASGGDGNDYFSLMGRQNSTLNGGVGADRYSFGIDVAAIGDNPDTLQNASGIFRIQENFKDKEWGTIDLSSLNLEWVNPTTGMRPGGRRNTDKNDLWVSLVGNDVVYDIRYNAGGESLKIILEGALPHARTIGSHVILS
jgi:Ca2+-binding RTX toxin-like protein